jgi:alkanesulfonate monooxygenase SsuD/methylene tetrahydromethanopterin reductase-like flavin-dependent oxidoreductase (luciferase family)
MRFSINIPNFGEFADARTVATVAVAAEQAGWDALFVWDHVVHDKRQRRGQPFGDPWMLLTAAALTTSRLRLGTLVTPVARRRPEQLARQVATLDSLSDGRVIFGAGLGGPLEDEFASFGETTDPIVLAERLDEGLALPNRYWSGESGGPSRAALPGPGRHPAARLGATPPPTGLDRRVLATPPTYTPSRALGRRGPPVHHRPARTRPTCGPSPRPRRLRPPTPCGPAERAVRDRPRRRQPG